MRDNPFRRATANLWSRSIAHRSLRLSGVAAAVLRPFPRAVDVDPRCTKRVDVILRVVDRAIAQEVPVVIADHHPAVTGIPVYDQTSGIGVSERPVDELT
jgi:hypothetical protein